MQVIVLCRKLFSILLSLIVLSCSLTAYSEDISAHAYITMDEDSGVVLSERNSHSCYPMASTTKIMTCLLACESDKLNDLVTITSNMLDGVYGSMIYIKPDDTITLIDLVKGAMLASGNDAANAIAVYLYGSVNSFVKKMNARASNLGMYDTRFVTPSGLDEANHHSTAYDMAILAREALNNKALSSIFCKSSDEITINDKKQTIYNHNKLLSYDDSFIGIKTGFTDKAGRCLVSAYNYNDSKIIAVTLNAPNDWDDHKKLVEIAKKKYTHVIDEFEFNHNIVGGTLNIVKCSARYDLYTLNNVTSKAYYFPFSYAPVKKGDCVGYVNLYCDKTLIKTVEIIALEEVKKWQTTK